MLRHIKPLLAYNKAWEVDAIRYPVLASPKLDGIRAMRQMDGALTTRTGKKIPNTLIRDQLTDTLLAYPGFFDGEITMLGYDYNDIESIVMSEHHACARGWIYTIFDYARDENMLGTRYWNRYLELNNLLAHYRGERLHVINNVMCYDSAQLKTHHTLLVANGYEGTIVRRVDAHYKMGRSTLREQIMLKYVDYVREEAVVTGVECAYENLDAGNSKKLENLVPLDRAGTLRVHNKRWGEFNIGSGWDHETGREWLANPELVLHKTITYKYKPHGTKDKPRQPIFVGFRAEFD